MEGAEKPCKAEADRRDGSGVTYLFESDVLGLLTVTCVPRQLVPDKRLHVSWCLPLALSLFALLTRCLVVVLIDPSIFGLDENFHASGEVWQGDLLWVFHMGYRATVKCIKTVDGSTAVLNTTRLVASLIFVLSITREVSARLNGFLLSVPGVGVLREETASSQLFHLFWKPAFFAMPCQAVGLVLTVALSKVGLRFLVHGNSVEEIILNATALVFVCEVDDLLFSVLNTIFYQFKGEVDLEIRVPPHTRLPPLLVDRLFTLLFLVSFIIAALEPFLAALSLVHHRIEGLPPSILVLDSINTVIYLMPVAALLASLFFVGKVLFYGGAGAARRLSASRQRQRGPLSSKNAAQKGGRISKGESRRAVRGGTVHGEEDDRSSQELRHLLDLEDGG